MGLLDNLLGQLAGGGQAKLEEHFDQATQTADPGQISDGLAAAFRSDQTPPFADMVGQLFGNSTDGQRAGVLNQLIQALGPVLMSGAAGNILSKVMTPGATQITPDQASQITPEEMTQIAQHAEQAHPGAVDAVSEFYAQHSTLIKTLGGAALAIALAKLKDRQ